VAKTLCICPKCKNPVNTSKISGFVQCGNTIKNKKCGNRFSIKENKVKI